MTYLRVQDREKTAWRVICPHHGPVCLTREEYNAQMAAPNYGWVCCAFDMGNPKDPDDVGPGVCGAKARWDDAWYDMWLDELEKENDLAEAAPDGCLGCNPDKIQPVLDAHGIRVESIPTPSPGQPHVVVCEKCGQAWLMMPRDTDTKKPVA